MLRHLARAGTRLIQSNTSMVSNSSHYINPEKVSRIISLGNRELSSNSKTSFDSFRNDMRERNVLDCSPVDLNDPLFNEHAKPSSQYYIGDQKSRVPKEAPKIKQPEQLESSSTIRLMNQSQRKTDHHSSYISPEGKTMKKSQYRHIELSRALELPSYLTEPNEPPYYESNNVSLWVNKGSNVLLLPQRRLTPVGTHVHVTETNHNFFIPPSSPSISSNYRPTLIDKYNIPNRPINNNPRSNLMSSNYSRTVVSKQTGSVYTHTHRKFSLTHQQIADQLAQETSKLYTPDSDSEASDAVWERFANVPSFDTEEEAQKYFQDLESSPETDVKTNVSSEQIKNLPRTEMSNTLKFIIAATEPEGVPDLHAAGIYPYNAPAPLPELHYKNASGRVCIMDEDEVEPMIYTHTIGDWEYTNHGVLRKDYYYSSCLDSMSHAFIDRHENRFEDRPLTRLKSHTKAAHMEKSFLTVAQAVRKIIQSGKRTIESMLYRPSLIKPYGNSSPNSDPDDQKIKHRHVKDNLPDITSIPNTENDNDDILGRLEHNRRRNIGSNEGNIPHNQGEDINIGNIIPKSKPVPEYEYEEGPYVVPRVI